LGKIVEIGQIDEVLDNPKHPYTQALIDAISEPDPENLKKERMIRIKETTVIENLDGCKFKNRCPYAIEKCNIEPKLEKIANEHYVACYIELD
jgi:peptide/nickel transport system ATP-binding protein